MSETLVLVSFDKKCPNRRPLNETLQTVAEYERMCDDTFMLLGLQCELENGGLCPDSRTCDMRKSLPLTLDPMGLEEADHYLCYVDYEGAEIGHTNVLDDCKQRYVVSKNKSMAG
jgi:hypothetical protein